MNKYKGIDIKFTKIKAHSGVEFNEMADKLAKEAVERNDPCCPF